MYYSERMADWAVSLCYEDLPPDVIEIAKRAIADWTFATIYGARSEWGKIVVDIVKTDGGSKESTILVDGTMVPCTNAAMANAVMSLAYDMTDTFLAHALHPSCSIVAGALAVGEKQKSAGKEIITAVIAGYELTNRIGDALSLGKRYLATKGYEAQALLPVFGTTIAAGKLLRLDADKMNHTLAITPCSIGGGLIEYLIDGNWTYRWNVGRAAHDGVLTALLAQRGFIGPDSVFEGHWDDKGRFGIVNAIAGDISWLNALDKDLGKEWAIRKLGFKGYGCCHYNQGFQDGMLKLIRQYKFRADDIEEVICYVPHMTLFLGVPRKLKVRPPNLTVAGWALPIVLAVTTLDGHLLDPATQTSDQRIQEPAVLTLADKIKVELDKNLDDIISKRGELMSPMKVRLKGGKEFSINVGCKGFSNNPVSDDEFDTKFRTLAKGVISKDLIDSLITHFAHLELVPDVSQLTKLMVA